MAKLGHGLRRFRVVAVYRIAGMATFGEDGVCAFARASPNKTLCVRTYGHRWAGRNRSLQTFRDDASVRDVLRGAGCGW